MKTILRKLASFSDWVDSIINYWRDHFKKLENVPALIRVPIYTMLALIASLVLTGLLLGLSYLIIDIYNGYFHPTDDKQFSDIRTSLLIFAALLGAPFFLWRTYIAQQQSNIARDRGYTELFNKAIEQLGAEKPAFKALTNEAGEPLTDEAGRPLTQETRVPNIEVRIGAIFALGRIMKDSPKDAPAIVQTLCAYIRENCGEPEPFEFAMLRRKKGQSLDDWLDNIRSTVRRMKEEAHSFRTIAEKKADRSDVQTALNVFSDRPLELNDTKNKHDLRRVNFQGADLQGLDFRDCNLQGAHLQGANLSRAKMLRADLSLAEMQGAKLWGAEMQGAKLSSAKMQGADLWNAEMQEANLWDANMQGADLSSAEMQGAKLSSAKMQGANLRNAEMQEVQITSARKTAASVIWVDFTKTSFEPDTLQEQLEDMFGHKEHTKLPDGISPPDHWSEADMDTPAGNAQYRREWKAFKKKMGVDTPTPPMDF